MQRAIPPDLSQAKRQQSSAARQRESIGDLHLAADNFSGAIEAYTAALREVGRDAPAEQSRILQRLAEAHVRKGDYPAALEALHRARELARLLRDPRETAMLVWTARWTGMGF